MSPYRKGCTCGMQLRVGATAEEDERSAEELQPVDLNRRIVGKLFQVSTIVPGCKRLL